MAFIFSKSEPKLTSKSPFSFESLTINNLTKTCFEIKRIPQSLNYHKQVGVNKIRCLKQRHTKEWKKNYQIICEQLLYETKSDKQVFFNSPIIIT